LGKFPRVFGGSKRIQESKYDLALAQQLQIVTGTRVGTQGIHLHDDISRGKELSAIGCQTRFRFLVGSIGEAGLLTRSLLHKDFQTGLGQIGRDRWY
jgi:hypothetical protein